MATEVQIQAVVDAVVTAFDGDPAKFEAFLTRAALETELAELESEARNIQTEQNASNKEFQTALEGNAEARAAKQVEIDAL